MFAEQFLDLMVEAIHKHCTGNTIKIEFHRAFDQKFKPLMHIPMNVVYQSGDRGPSEIRVSGATEYTCRAGTLGSCLGKFE